MNQNPGFGPGGMTYDAFLSTLWTGRVLLHNVSAALIAKMVRLVTFVANFALNSAIG